MSELGAGAAPARRDEGRRVILEPTPPGLWPLLLGVALAALAPMAGFLVGSAIGVGDDPAAEFDPMYLALFAGILVGGVGVVIAIAGGWRLWRHSHRRGGAPGDGPPDGGPPDGGALPEPPPAAPGPSAPRR